MPATAALAVRAHATLLLVASALAVVLAAAVGPSPAALLTAVAASAALVVVVATVAVREFVAAPAEAALRIGHRAREHRDSLDRIAAPTHPDTAGRVRSRAPGGVAPAA
jgi:hypothetical protein